VNSRPQELVLALLGATVLDRHTEPLPSRVFLDVLDRLGVADAAARATLNRMTHSGLLERGRRGREAVYAITPACRRILRRGAERVHAPAPFDHEDGDWTLLSFSLPESHRDLRHRLRSRLQWAGFGAARDGLWIAPGVVDVDEVLDGIEGFDPLTHPEAFVDAFAGRPLPPTDVRGLVRRAWDLASIRGAHDAFLARWEHRDHGDEPLALLTTLLADWIHLLRTDPGLPAVHLSADWPSRRTTNVFRALHDRHEPAARAAFDAAAGRD